MVSLFLQPVLGGLQLLQQSLILQLESVDPGDGILAKLLRQQVEILAGTALHGLHLRLQGLGLTHAGLLAQQQGSYLILLVLYLAPVVVFLMLQSLNVSFESDDVILQL